MTHTRKEALEALLEKVEAGHAPNYTPDYEYALFPIKGMWSAYKAMDAYHGSLDAAKALHEAVLPKGSTWSYYSSDGHCIVSYGPGLLDYEEAHNDATARAWLIAILRALIALIAQEDHTDD